MIKMIEFENKQGLMLRGFLDIPDGAKEIVVMLHGFTGNKTEHNGHFRTLSRMLSKIGVASLRMDYDCNGESDGEFGDFIFENAVEDSKLMIEYAKKIKGIEKVYLLGFSMGGAIASIIADDKDIYKLILWSPAGEMVEHAHQAYDRWRRIPNGNAYTSGFELSKKFVDSIDKFNMYQNTKNYTNGVLIIQGDKDLSVSPECSYRYKNEFKNSTIHIIEGAGHGYDGYEQLHALYDLTIDYVQATRK